MTPEARAKMLAKTGGFVQAKAEGPALLFLNAQTRVPASVMDDPVEQIGKIMRLPAARKNTPDTAEPIKTALAALQDKGVAAVVVVGDTAKYPSLLIAPEARWALVNVAALGGAGVTAETLADRTRKEVWRAFGYLMGAGHTNFEMCLMKPVFSTSDLDGLRAQAVCPEPFNQILAAADKMGIKPLRRGTYLQALQQGWAPEPANEFQKALWEQHRQTKPNDR